MPQKDLKLRLIMDKISIRILTFFILNFVVTLSNTSIKAEVASVIFEEPEDYVLYDKVPHQVIRVRVSDEIGDPVPFVKVDFLSSDTDIADFIFPTTITDSNGLAVSVIQCQVSSDTIVSPPPEFDGRTPTISATAGGITSSEVPVRILWGVIVEPIFMGPYFDRTFESFVDTSVKKGGSLTLQGKFVEVFDIPPLDLYDFGVYSTDSQIAYADTVIIHSNKIIVEIFGLADGTTNIIVDGIPPAVLTVKVHSVINVENPGPNIPLFPILRQNYPNPFNSETTIEYEIANKMNVSIKIYNSRGQLITHLVNERQSAGRYKTKWDGVDKFGQYAPSGVYIYQIKAGDFISSRKLILLK